MSHPTPAAEATPYPFPPAIAEFVGRLSCQAVDSTPVAYDWNASRYDDDPPWRYVAAETCPECGAVVIYAEDHADGCERADEDGDELAGYDGGPMMNYYYPAEIDDPDEAGRLLADTCLVVVEVDGRTGLALTGGGMDLSWEIAAAFVALGMLPPVHFADLPGMAGMTASVGNLTTAAAMFRSCEVMAMRQARNVERLTATVAGLRPVEVEA